MNVEQIKRRRIIKTIVIAVCVYVVFAAVVITLFFKIRNDPIDKVSMTYIYDETDIEDKYGEIRHVARNLGNPKLKTESAAKTPYHVETETHDLLVYVIATNDGTGWQARSYEVIEVRQK